MSPCSLIPREGSSCPPLFKNPLHKSKQSSLLCPRFLSYHCLHPVRAQAFDLPGTLALLCFISGTQLGLKTSHLKGPGMAQTHSPPPEESLVGLCLVLFCPRKAVGQPCSCLEFLATHGKKTSDHLICPMHTPLLNGFSKVSISQVFCSWRGIIFSSKFNSGKGTFSLSLTQGIPHHALHSQVSFFLPCWSTTPCPD